jgi:hypothetical protein
MGERWEKRSPAHDLAPEHVRWATGNRPLCGPDRQAGMPRSAAAALKPKHEVQACPTRGAGLPQKRCRAAPKEMGAGIAASPHCAERRICRCSVYLVPPRKRFGPRFSILAHQLRRRFLPGNSLLRGAGPAYSTARPEGSLVVRPFRPGIWNRSSSKPKPSDVPRPFLGRPLSRPASLTRPSVPTRRTANPGAASR